MFQGKSKAFIFHNTRMSGIKYFNKNHAESCQFIIIIICIYLLLHLHFLLDLCYVCAIQQHGKEVVVFICYVLRFDNYT